MVGPRGRLDYLEKKFSDRRHVSQKSQELFRPKKPVVKMQFTCFEKIIFYDVFNVRKLMIAKFEGLEPQRCPVIKGIVVPEIGPKSFWTQLFKARLT